MASVMNHNELHSHMGTQAQLSHTSPIQQLQCIFMLQTSSEYSHTAFPVWCSVFKFLLLLFTNRNSPIS